MQVVTGKPINFSNSPVSPGTHSLTKKPEDSRYEIDATPECFAGVIFPDRLLTKKQNKNKTEKQTKQNK